MSTFNNYVDICKHACWHATWCKLFQWWHIILHVDKIMLHVDKIMLHVHADIDKLLVDIIACRGQMYATIICMFCLWVDDTILWKCMICNYMYHTNVHLKRYENTSISTMDHVYWQFAVMSKGNFLGGTKCSIYNNF